MRFYFQHSKMKKYLVIFCFYYFPVSAQDHKTTTDKPPMQSSVETIDKETKKENEFTKEEIKTIQDLKKEERSEATKQKPIKRGRTRKTIIKVEK